MLLGDGDGQQVTGMVRATGDGQGQGQWQKAWWSLSVDDYPGMVDEAVLQFLLSSDVM